MRADTSAPAGAADSAPVGGAYLRALLDADLPAARRVLDDAVAAGLPVAALYLDVLQPNPRSRSMTAPPIRPVPITPMVRSRSSFPRTPSSR